MGTLLLSVEQQAVQVFRLCRFGLSFPIRGRDSLSCYRMIRLRPNNTPSREYAPAPNKVAAALRRRVATLTIDRYVGARKSRIIPPIRTIALRTDVRIPRLKPTQITMAGMVSSDGLPLGRPV